MKAGLSFGSEQIIRAVDGVDLNILDGETVGLVGETGCGKTTLGRTILRLIEPTFGEIFFDGRNLCEFTKEEMRKARRNMQIIFQDPFSSLNPRMKVKDIIGEPLIVHGVANKDEIKKIVSDIIINVGLRLEHLDQYPHEFSGGQRQRIAIARALSVNPKFIVLDEPTSALDVSVRAKILNLLVTIQKNFKFSSLFISHDLDTVKYIADKIYVMYAGKIVENGSVEAVFLEPIHPYTQALLSANPIADPEQRNREKIVLHGEVPSPINPPSGCRFHTRCRYKKTICVEKIPELREIGPQHIAACHLL